MVIIITLLVCGEGWWGELHVGGDLHVGGELHVRGELHVGRLLGYTVQTQKVVRFPRN